ncbi:MAG: hypothetical protein HON70_35220 [Lentisphaerae bacterium]|nr:hypothetical protein [Lentisphaerota bacterium]
MMPSDAKGRATVRELAQRVAELAQTSENRARRQLWCDVNSLRRPERPPIVCHPGSGAWNEILPASVLVAADPFLRGLEYQFRKSLHKWEIGDDTVLEPWVTVPTVMRLEGQSLWGLPVTHIRPEDASTVTPTRTAWRYEPPIKEESDIDRIVLPRYHHDREATQTNLERMNGLLGDLLPVRETCAVPGPGAWLHGWATQLRGVEQLLFDLMDCPQWVHRLMRTLMDGHLGVMEQFEQAGVLTLNNVNLMACDDLPQPDSDPQLVRLKDLWGRGESQEFQGVSPAQHEEFLLQYQKPILERSGLSFYGCCEDLTNKIPLILSIPNLRRFVCSPWTDLGTLVDAVGDRYCIEWRQKATDVAYAPDLSAVRKHLVDGFERARGGCLMVVLQELETVNHNPRRLRDWAALAKEVGSACSG